MHDSRRARWVLSAQVLRRIHTERMMTMQRTKTDYAMARGGAPPSPAKHRSEEKGAEEAPGARGSANPNQMC